MRVTGSILQDIESFASLDFLFSTGRQKFSSEDGPVSRGKAKETRWGHMQYQREGEEGVEKVVKIPKAFREENRDRMERASKV